jgi:hypothetical protein
MIESFARPWVGKNDALVKRALGRTRRFEIAFAPATRRVGEKRQPADHSSVSKPINSKA